MQDRWFIYKNGQTLGPFTAEQIRAALRDGSVDPFDLVARDGSSVRRELVEVDELFQSRDVSYDAGSRPGTVPPDSDMRRLDRDGSHSGHEAAGAGRDPGPMAGQGQLMLAATSRDTVARERPENAAAPLSVKRTLVLSPAATPAAAPAPQQPRRKRRDPRHFHVLDGRGRMMGPITAGEIQSLYYKGVLDKSVKVLRDGSSARVSIDKFVLVYAESRGHRAMVQGAHPALAHGRDPRRRFAGMQRRPMGVRLQASFSPVTIAVIILALILSGLAVWIVVTSQSGGYAARPDAGVRSLDTPTPGARSKAQPKPKTKPKAKPKTKQDVGVLPRPVDAAGKRRAALARQAALAAERQAAQVSRAAAARNERLQEARAKRLRVEKARDQQRQKERLAAERRARLAKSAKRPSAAALVMPSPQSGRPGISAPSSPKVVKASAGPSGVAALADGQTVTGLGPMTFDRGAVESCDGSCNITFSGAGGSVRVAFFKQVWGPTLLAKSGGVYVSGLVRKDGGSTKIILSNVK